MSADPIGTLEKYLENGDLPKLPGFQIRTPNIRPQAKPQQLRYINGIPGLYPESAKIHARPKSAPVRKPVPPPSLQRSGRQAASQQLQVKDMNVVEQQPAWLAYDRQVLRYYGYVKETVSERRDEVLRVRKYVLSRFANLCTNVRSDIYMHAPVHEIAGAIHLHNYRDASTCASRARCDWDFVHLATAYRAFSPSLVVLRINQLTHNSSVHSYVCVLRVSFCTCFPLMTTSMWCRRDYTMSTHTQARDSVLPRGRLYLHRGAQGGEQRSAAGSLPEATQSHPSRNWRACEFP